MRRGIRQREAVAHRAEPSRPRRSPPAGRTSSKLEPVHRSQAVRGGGPPASSSPHISIDPDSEIVTVTTVAPAPANAGNNSTAKELLAVAPKLYRGGYERCLREPHLRPRIVAHAIQPARPV